MPRRERRDVDDMLTRFCWIDEDGNPTDWVPDRFQSRYAWRDERNGDEGISTFTLADNGFATMTLRDLVTLGFSTAEYIDIMAYENEHSRNIQNEEELNALYPGEIDEDCPPNPYHPPFGK